MGDRHSTGASSVFYRHKFLATYKISHVNRWLMSTTKVPAGLPSCLGLKM